VVSGASAEADARLLGDVRSCRVLEVGCGSAMCSRWLVGQGGRPVATDLSCGMLAQGRARWLVFFAAWRSAVLLVFRENVAVRQGLCCRVER
jgi:2-polyprenyl-3-methyl-5-hydroxy-6-metoxy-1,4-benzoquinol methylase